MDKLNRRELLSTAIPAVLGATAVAAGPLPAAIVGTAEVPNIDMGLGELGSPTITFVRQFRFLFWFEHMGPEFNYSVVFDRVKKEIRFKTYEIFKNGVVPVQQWIDAMLNNEFPDETMTLATYDGCGKELYRKQFTGLKINACLSTFDCSSSECAMPEVCLTYESLKDVPVGGEKHKTSPKECQVDHLNGRRWTQ